MRGFLLVSFITQVLVLQGKEGAVELGSPQLVSEGPRVLVDGFLPLPTPTVFSGSCSAGRCGDEPLAKVPGAPAFSRASAWGCWRSGARRPVSGALRHGSSV